MNTRNQAAVVIACAALVSGNLLVTAQVAFADSMSSSANQHGCDSNVTYTAADDANFPAAFRPAGSGPVTSITYFGSTGAVVVATHYRFDTRKLRDIELAKLTEGAIELTAPPRCAGCAPTGTQSRIVQQRSKRGPEVLRVYDLGFTLITTDRLEDALDVECLLFKPASGSDGAS